MLLCPSTDHREGELGLNTLHLDKATIAHNITSQQKVPFRARPNSCRVSFKRVFPTQDKQKTEAESNNVSGFFNHNEERLSTIAGDSEQE